MASTAFLLFGLLQRLRSFQQQSLAFDQCNFVFEAGNCQLLILHNTFLQSAFIIFTSFLDPKKRGVKWPEFFLKSHLLATTTNAFLGCFRVFICKTQLVLVTFSAGMMLTEPKGKSTKADFLKEVLADFLKEVFWFFLLLLLLLLRIGGEQRSIGVRTIRGGSSRCSSCFSCCCSIGAE